MKSPERKKFATGRYKEGIDKLRKNMPGRVIEEFSEKVARNVLRKYERIEQVEKGPHFRGTPFDLFAVNDGVPYIVELKGSLSDFNVPAETQKRRMKTLLRKIRGLKVALLQIALKKGEYRIFYHEDMKRLFATREASIEPIVGWIRERL